MNNEQCCFNLKFGNSSLTLVGTVRGISRVELGMAGKDKTFADSCPDWKEEAVRQFGEYFGGERKTFQLPLDISEGTPFQKQVWKECGRIPYGQWITYSELAQRIKRPGGSRAVGQALGKNPLPTLIPCHRVIGKDGRLTGFSAGIHWKEMLVKLEGSEPTKERTESA